MNHEMLKCSVDQARGFFVELLLQNAHSCDCFNVKIGAALHKHQKDLEYCVHEFGLTAICQKAIFQFHSETLQPAVTKTHRNICLCSQKLEEFCPYSVIKEQGDVTDVSHRLQFTLFYLLVWETAFYLQRH